MNGKQKTGGRYGDSERDEDIEKMEKGI